ncbi:MAG: murein biosynthesis integral membrane protein MurJ [Gemmatimonadota bacterium]|nr:MAG: murein biosynthesis integral membrane protein MurJ [Gemmatimonadota bacterium]
MRPSQGRLATKVGLAILLSRILGLIRERVFAHYFGTGLVADAFGAAQRIPNVIRNLLGEGTLSASFIPVYAGMIQRGEIEDARRLAGVIASLLILLAALAALLGIALAPVITDFVAPGFTAQERDLTITLVRILFPMSGALILSAWCLGILNTHRRFFLAYSAPAVWNIAQIATLLALGGYLIGASLAVAVAWGAVVGSVLQILVQLPVVLRVARRVIWSLDIKAAGVRKVITAWIPVIFGAGVVQISSIIDIQLASLLPSGAVATLRYAQLIQILPISLFGVSVAAVALPELSRDVASEDNELLRRRLGEGIRQVAFFALPSAFAFAALGPQLVGVLFQTGVFDEWDTALVGGVLAAYGLAVPAQAQIKLLASGHYALGDTRTPVRIAAIAVVVSASCAFLLMQVFGAAGIALGAAAGAYVNVTLNAVRLRQRLGIMVTAVEFQSLVKSALAAVMAAAVAVLALMLLRAQSISIQALLSVALFCAIYGLAALALRHPDARRIAKSWKSKSAKDG